jgi:hypothetical protein
MNTVYATENAAERQRLFVLTEKWAEADLTRELANDWSVATKLAHLAFWDLYYLALIEHWERTGFRSSSAEVDAINLAVRHISRAIPPAAAAELARASADAIDRKLETIDSGLEEAIEESGHVRLLRRAIHRREHLDQIERALETKGA